MNIFSDSESFFAVGRSSGLSAFGVLGAFVLGGTIFVLIGLLVTKFLAPHRPNPEKQSTYECGEDPIGEPGIQFHIRFYLVALVFLIFEVEILFLFPWATIFADPEWIAADPRWGILAFAEMVIFALILILGLVYVWRRNDLDQGGPSPALKSENSAVSAKYQVVNNRYLNPQKAVPLTES